MLPKNTQYLIAGAIALYIVLMTRPAPAMITNLLSSSVAQIAALALVIYVGATQSLIVAVVLAVAVVMSTPSREYMTVDEKKKLDKKPVAKKPAAKPVKDLGKEATKASKPTPSTAEPKPSNVAKTAEPSDSDEPAPAGHSVAESTKKETFSLMNAADF
jgi:outer membrane biosynthesis protein TonB